MVDSEASPLSAAELAEIRGQLLILQGMSAKVLAKATVDIPTLLDGTARLLATVAALQAQVAELTRERDGALLELRLAKQTAARMTMTPKQALESRRAAASEQGETP